MVADPRWRRLIPRVESLAQRAAKGADATIVLGSDRLVRRLNAAHRGRDKPTNVLSYDATREIILARETVRREAAAAGRPVRHHLAHLIIHGLLHLEGHDHARAGQARRMEAAEARLLRRIGVPNPWRSR